MSDPVALSRSRIWSRQRAYYSERASEAFAEIPHQILDNPFVAASYARVVLGYVRDWARSGFDRSEPLYVVELGAGAGRFAHGFVRELRARLDAVPLDVPELVYVMTDLGQRTLDDWAANPALAGIEFARFDVAHDATLAGLERVANPLVVIANYLFDSVPADAFAIAGGVIEACLVDDDGATVSRRPAAPYEDADLDALLEHYRRDLSDTVVTIPTTAIACLRRLRALAGDRLLLLAGDKAHSTAEALAYRAEPELTRHSGAFSLMVNFHALGWYAERHGGEALTGGDRHVTLDVGAFLFGAPPGGYAETRLAYAEAIERFSPDDHSVLGEGVERAADRLSVPALVALLRLSGWDAFTLLGVADTLRERVADADEALQEDLRDALYETYDRHFAVPGEGDLPFAIGTLLYAMEDYEDALEFFEASLEQHGPHIATERNIELCEAQLM